MRYQNIGSIFFHFVTEHACKGYTDGQTDGQNYDPQDRANIAASRGKTDCIYISYHLTISLNPRNTSAELITHAIDSLKAAVDYYVRHDSYTINLCTIDLLKAFNGMNHHALSVELMQRRIPSKLLYISEQWFLAGLAWVKCGSFVCDFFDRMRCRAGRRSIALSLCCLH